MSRKRRVVNEPPAEKTGHRYGDGEIEVVGPDADGLFCVRIGWCLTKAVAQGLAAHIAGAAGGAK